ncbi:MAG: T9SS type A sorting domain-containing protein [FCB group bacterium]|nr:T9SS type A sorting domain-containing protein [FCB group bacterium]
MIFLLILLILTCNVYAQPPDSLWSRTFGTTGDDVCLSIYPTSDDGYILFGNYEHLGATYAIDYGMFKINQDGDSLWSSLFSVTDNILYLDFTPTSDGGIILSGTANVPYEIICMGDMRKIDSLGNHEWWRGYGNGYFLRGLKEDYDGLIVTGYGFDYVLNDKCFWLLKTDFSGNFEWERFYNTEHDDVFCNVVVTEDRDYVLAGFIANDIVLMKTDCNGDSLWSKTYPFYNNNFNVGLELDEEGNYIIHAIAGSLLKVIKVDSNGDSIWCRQFNNLFCSYYHEARLAEDGGLIIAGSIDNPLTEHDFALMKIDSNGDSLWTQTYGGMEYERCYCMSTSSDEGFLLGGRIWNEETEEPDFLLIKTGPDNSGINNNPHPGFPDSFELYNVYPNPFNSECVITFATWQTSKISISVYDLIGREISILADGEYSAGTHEASFNGADLPSGIYFAKMEVEGMMQYEKILLIK